MDGPRERPLLDLLISVGAHLALLALFGLPAALPLVQRPSEPPRPAEGPRRSGNRERPARNDAPRRLERDLPRVRPEAPPEQRKLVLVPVGSGLADHDARATGGIPGLARPASAEGPLGKAVKLPDLSPDQLENAKSSAATSTRRDAERAPIQRPDLDRSFGLFASLVSEGRHQPDPGRTAAVQAQAAAPDTQAAAPPQAQHRPETPSSDALPPPPGAALAPAERERPPPQAPPREDEPLRAAPRGVEAPKIEGAEARQAQPPKVAQTPLRPAFEFAPPLSFSRAAPHPNAERRPDARTEEKTPEEAHARKGQDEATGKEPAAGERPRRDVAAEPPESRQARRAQEEESGAPAPAQSATGLWVAEGRSEPRPASGEPQPSPRALAEGRPQEQPTRIALAATPRAVGAGDEASRKAQLPSESAPVPKTPVTSQESRLSVEAFEGGEEGARRAERSALSRAAPEKRLVGEETVAGHSEGVPAAGLVVVAPEGDGSGDEEGLASVAGNADLRHLVQERVNHVSLLVGPGLVKRTGQRGTAVARFRVDEKGYVRAVRLERSTGAPELDRELEAVLRLAEPYPGWRGWMKVAISFGTPPIDL